MGVFLLDGAIGDFLVLYLEEVEKPWSVVTVKYDICVNII